MRRKTFTHEFKQECVNLVLQHKYPVTRAAETMNIGLRLGNGKYCTLRLFFVLADINCSQRTILPFCQLLIVSPDIVSCQIYVLPAQRRQV